MKTCGIIGIIILSLMGFVGCASNTTSKQYITRPAEPENYRAHPAAYLTDRFTIDREIEKREPAELPFFFQKCSRNVGTYIGTNTQYDCN